MIPRICLGLVVGLLSSTAQANGLLIPVDRVVPPLAMVSHRVSSMIDEQVAVTTVEQVFRNHTHRALEATYLFPVPRGASVNKFVMWIDGKETHGELLEARKAHQIYTDIVRRTQDPGLLEYLGNDLMRMRVFPVPARGDQKVKISFTSIAPREAGLIEFLYPIRTDNKATRTLEDLSVKVRMKSKNPILSVYSPTHSVTTLRKSSNEVEVDFDRKQLVLDRDFQLFFATSASEVGITPMIHKPLSSADGHVMLLISPQVQSSARRRIPRDLVLVLDKSGSMSDVKMSQARKALKHCLAQLDEQDRFALVSFSTTVNAYQDELKKASSEQLEQANKWVEDIRQGGGTAILPALHRALEFRSSDLGRSFNVVFFTDGLPTVDETNPDKIVKSIAAKNSSNTRIFTFGVGDDVNASMLDQLADVTRAVSTYVRPAEDIEAKVSSLQHKISHPAMTNVRLSVEGGQLSEVFPPNLPDLFHGSQLIVLGKLMGSGAVTIRLTGRVGEETLELVETIRVPVRTHDSRDFVEHLWARRKVGYLLDQIRAHGEQKELVDEVISLARRYGIATPYTSYLVLPDALLPVAAPGRGSLPNLGLPVSGPGPLDAFRGAIPTAPNAPAIQTQAVAERAAAASRESRAGVGAARGQIQSQEFEKTVKELPASELKRAASQALRKLQDETRTLEEAAKNYKLNNLRANQTGKQGVDLAIASDQLRNQNQLTQTASRMVQGRNCVEIGGVWIDEKYQESMSTLRVKAQSPAYFRILEMRPDVKDVYRLGNYVVWIAPGGTALMIDPREGKEAITDQEIEQLFQTSSK